MSAIPRRATPTARLAEAVGAIAASAASQCIQCAGYVRRARETGARFSWQAGYGDGQAISAKTVFQTLRQSLSPSEFSSALESARSATRYWRDLMNRQMKGAQ